MLQVSTKKEYMCLDVSLTAFNIRASTQSSVNTYSYFINENQKINLKLPVSILNRCKYKGL